MRIITAGTILLAAPFATPSAAHPRETAREGAPEDAGRGIADDGAGPAAVRDDAPADMQDQRLREVRLPVGDPAARPPRRIRVGAGIQFQPGFPGNDDLRFNPLFIVSRTRGDEPFRFGAPNDGNALPLLRFHTGDPQRGFDAGPLMRLEGRRRSSDLGGNLPEVGRTVELGGYVQFWLGEHVRLRGDVRQGVGGHEGLISQLGADFVARDADNWVFSIGPRAMLANGRYQRAWFGVPAETAALTGMPQFTPDGGLRGVAATSRLLYQFTPKWGAVAQVMYERLVDDAGRSPIIRRADSRNQLSFGAGLTYTFSIR